MISPGLLRLEDFFFRGADLRAVALFRDGLDLCGLVLARWVFLGPRAFERPRAILLRNAAFFLPLSLAMVFLLPGFAIITSRVAIAIAQLPGGAPRSAQRDHEGPASSQSIQLVHLHHVGVGDVE
jgi:hypothetical protein